MIDTRLETIMLALESGFHIQGIWTGMCHDKGWVRLSKSNGQELSFNMHELAKYIKQAIHHEPWDITEELQHAWKINTDGIENVNRV